MNPAQLPARAGTRNLIHVVVDTPKGSRNKYKYDQQWSCFKLAHVLPQGMYFPFDFGSVPGTLAPDGDPLDVLVLVDEPSFPGCLLTVKLIGVIEARQKEKGKTLRNDRILAVLETGKNRSPLTHIRELDRTLLAELEAFFINYNRAHGKSFTPLRRAGPAAAEKLLQSAIQAFGEKPRSRATATGLL